MVERLKISRPLKAFFEGRRCLVTGHTGFKGAWLCLWLHSLGAKISGYALEPPTTPNLFELADLGKLVEECRGDIRNYHSLAQFIQRVGPEIVFHLAAQSIVRIGYKEPKETFDVNVGGTVNLLEALRSSSSVRAIVVITSDKCYENREWTCSYRETDHLGGHDPYSASKGAAEIVTSSYERSFFSPGGVGLATSRAGNVIGGGDWGADRIIPDAVRSLEVGKPVPVRNPSSIRPWQHVLEPLFGYLVLAGRLLEESSTGKFPSAGAWNFAPPTDSCRTVRDLIEAFLAAYGEGTWVDISHQQADVPHEAGLLTLAWDKAYHGLGWRPRWNFEEAVRRTSLWYRRYRQGVDPRDLCQEEIHAYMESK
jgi:CDP-glucose 4,6-dehydratase